MALLAAGCTSSGDGGPADAVATLQPSSTTTIVPTTTTAPPPVEPLGTVRVIRPNWDSSIGANSVLMLLLEDLGYEIEDVSVKEGRAVDLLYSDLATGEADITFEAWLPRHRSWFEGEVNGERIGDFLEVIDPPLQPAGGVQGFLVTKSWAEAEGITHLGQINDDPALVEALDADGDGLGEIYGCPDEWTCDDIIWSFIYNNAWESLEQLHRTRTTVQPEPYDAVFEAFLERVDRGEAAVAYTWTPTRYYANAAIGQDTLWLSVTNDAAYGGARGLHYWSVADNAWEIDTTRLNEDGTAGFAGLPSETCTQGPDGCQTGWLGWDIHAVANVEWLDANPIARALVEAVELDTIEVSQLLVELEQLELEQWSDKVEASRVIAREWLDANPDPVRTWLEAAR